MELAEKLRICGVSYLNYGQNAQIYPNSPSD
jgi:hypothetical protein